MNSPKYLCRAVKQGLFKRTTQSGNQNPLKWKHNARFEVTWSGWFQRIYLAIIKRIGWLVCEYGFKKYILRVSDTTKNCGGTILTGSMFDWLLIEPHSLGLIRPKVLYKLLTLLNRLRKKVASLFLALYVKGIVY